MHLLPESATQLATLLCLTCGCVQGS